MITIYDLMDAKDLVEMTKGGYVRVQRHPFFPYNIACYTKQAMFERAWNDVTKNCRGLIYHQETGEILARPFKKFFNLGEPNAPEFKEDDWVTVYDKVDGSLGIAYNTPVGPAIATKGSFASDQALKATELLRTKYRAYETDGIHTDLFEIIYPENRIVLDYGDEESLRYLGSVDIRSGKDFFDYKYMMYYGVKLNHFMMAGSWGHVREMIDLKRPNAEGVVVLNEETGDRLKLKQEDYIELHKVMTGLNEKQLWQWASDGKTYDEIMASIPEELHSWAEPILRDLFNRVQDYWDALEALWYNVSPELKKDRKAFAKWSEKWTAVYRSCLFMMLDGQESRVAELIWKQVKP